MKLISKFSLSFLFVFVLTIMGCGGGGGGDGATFTPTDPTLQFSLFAPGFLDGAYSDSVNYSGSSTTGESFTATLNAQSGADAIFGGLNVNVILGSASIRNVTTGAVAAGSSETYWTDAGSTVTEEGSYDVTNDIVYIASSTTPVPKLSTVGNFGNIGTYDGSDFTRTSSSWQLQDGGNGFAKLIITHVSFDTFDNLEYTEIHEDLISQDGVPITAKITITYHQLGNMTITLNSI